MAEMASFMVHSTGITDGACYPFHFMPRPVATHLFCCFRQTTAGALFQNETPARAAEPFEGRASRWFLGPLSVNVNSEALADIDGTVEDIEAKSLEVHAIDGSTEGSA